MLAAGRPFAGGRGGMPIPSYLRTISGARFGRRDRDRGELIVGFDRAGNRPALLARITFLPSGNRLCNTARHGLDLRCHEVEAIVRTCPRRAHSDPRCMAAHPPSRRYMGDRLSRASDAQRQLAGAPQSAPALLLKRPEKRRRPKPAPLRPRSLGDHNHRPLIGSPPSPIVLRRAGADASSVWAISLDHSEGSGRHNRSDTHRGPRSCHRGNFFATGASS